MLRSMVRVLAITVSFALLEAEQGADAQTKRNDKPGKAKAAAKAEAQTPAHWIWFDEGEPGKNKPAEQVWFRREVFADRPSTGAITVACDDHFVVWVNGKRLGEGDADRAHRFNLAGIVDAGTNVIAIEATNEQGRGGLYVEGGILYQQKSLEEGYSVSFNTGSGWRATRTAPTDDAWRKPQFAATGWTPIKDLGPHESSPWKALQLATAPADKSYLDRYSLAEGFTIERIAEPELVGTLVNMTWGNRGRLIVSREKGPILSLADRDSDGHYDEVAEYSVDVINCQGLCTVFDDLYAVGQGPQGVGIYRLPDRNHDDRADSVDLVIKHEENRMADHGPHNVVFGPDGWLYHNMGNHGRLDPKLAAPTSPVKHYYEGDLLRPRFEDARGHDRNGNPVPAGTIWRFSPDGKTWSLECAGFRNQYDIAFNSAGDLFTFDADMEWDVGTPWYRPCRVNHCVPGAEFGWRSGSAKWPEYYFDSLPATVNIGRGSPTGVVFYEHHQLPAKYFGSLLICDWSLGRLIAVFLKPNGATYSATWETIATGNPLNVSDVEVDRDGSIVLTTGGRNSEGGVYRIRYTGQGRGATVFKEETIADALAMPQPQSAWAREAIAKIKSRAGEGWEKELTAKASNGTAQEKVRALMLLSQFGPKPMAELLIQATKDPDDSVRQFATWLLGDHGKPEVGETLAKLFEDRNAMIQRRACEAYVRSGLIAPVLETRELMGSGDRWLRYASRLTLEAIPNQKWRGVFLDKWRTKGPLNVILAQHRAWDEPFYATFRAKNAFVLLESDHAIKQISIVDALRMIQLTILDGIDVAELEKIAKFLLDGFPRGNTPDDAETARILAVSKLPEATKRLVEVLEKEPDHVQQVHYALCLRYCETGWDFNLKRRVLDWYEKTKSWEGGASFAPFLANIVGEGLSRFTAVERKKLFETWRERPFATRLLMERSEPEQIADYGAVISRLVAELNREPASADRDALLDTTIAELGESATAESQALLRKLYDEQPDRRNELARTLAKHPSVENAPYLVRTLEFGDPTTVQVSIAALLKTPYRAEKPGEVRSLILAGLSLGGNGGLAAVNLLEKWTGGKAVQGAKPPAVLSDYQLWFQKKFPNEPPAELPKVDPTKAGHPFAELNAFLDSEAGQQGSVERGKLMFAKANCLKCHQFKTEGQGIGPDLTSVRRRFQRKEIVESIVYPSKVISDQYRSLTVVTSAGLVYTGLPLKQDNPNKLVLVLSDATKLEVSVADIEERSPAKVSVMPEGLFKDLSLSDIADLFAFLETSKYNMETPKTGVPK